MMRHSLSFRLLSSLLLLFAGACASTPAEEETPVSLPFYRDAVMTPEWISADSLDRVEIHQVGAFALTDQDGKGITEKEMEGNICVVDFFFTRCPSLCPKLTRNMLRIQDSLQTLSGARLFSFSVTPDVDSVPVLKAYAEANGVNDRWHLLTGPKAEIYRLARNSFFADVDTGAAAFLHTETFYLLDGKRRIRGIYNGTLGTDISRLVADARMLAEK